MPHTPLENLIAFDQDSASEERRAVLRSITDSFIVATDRYGRRDMAMFDLLLSRTATQMDHRLRKLIVMTLVRAGARDEHIRHALTQVRSPNERFLRRSVLQPVRDLLTFLQENADGDDLPADASLTDGNSVTLPTALLQWLFQYQLTVYRDALLARIGDERVGVMVRTAHRFRDNIISNAMEAGRDEVVVARRTIADWTRQGTITEEVLVELLESRAMTEFIFAMAEMFDMDIPTVIRVLNDTTMNSLAIVLKAHDIRRHTFSKIIEGFQSRQSDQQHDDTVLKLYDRLPLETAERAMRFWRVRVSDLEGQSEDAKYASA